MQRLSRRYSENEAVQAILEMWSESPQPVFPVRGPSKRGQLPALDFLSPRTRHLLGQVEDGSPKFRLEPENLLSR